MRFEAVNQKRSMRNWRCRKARCCVYIFNWRCWNWKMNQTFGFVHYIETYRMQTHQSFQLWCRHFSHNSQICVMGKGIQFEIHFCDKWELHSQNSFVFSFVVFPSVPFADTSFFHMCVRQSVLDHFMFVFSFLHIPWFLP